MYTSGRHMVIAGNGKFLEKFRGSYLAVIILILYLGRIYLHTKYTKMVFTLKLFQVLPNILGKIWFHFTSDVVFRSMTN